MNASDLDTICCFHNKLIAEYGLDGIDALGWLSNESQKARFNVLSGMADLTGRSVLDAGCGHADLLPYLSTRYGDIRYIGVEQMPVLLNVAVKRYKHLPYARFLHGNFSDAELPQADYIFACGSLSYRTSNTTYIFKMIEKLFAHCRLGFGFNLLSALKYPDNAIVSYDPNIILSFCNTLRTDIKFENGYWENDFTVMMYHQDRNTI